MTNLGNACGALGDVGKQCELQERSLAIQEAHFGPNHPDVAITLTSLGNAYGDSGDAEKQRDFLTRAHAVFIFAQHPLATDVQKMLQALGLMPPDSILGEYEARFKKSDK